MSKAIELGGGDKPRFRPNADVRPLPTVDIVVDFEKTPYPLPSDEYDLVYSQYLMEHLSWRTVQAFIGEVYRVLKPGGVARMITANLQAQCRVVAEAKEWQPNFAVMVFGDQDYSENTHRSGWSPEYAVKMFKEAGFDRVETRPLPNCATDMIIEGFKMGDLPAEEEYDRRYFEDGKTGYQLYRDFPAHWRLLERILDLKPESVLDVGGARGYVVKKLNDRGVRAVCLDGSRHAYETRATDDFVLHDARKVPWPFHDQEFDLCTSFSFFEHFREKDIDVIMKEMARVAKRGLFSITFEKTPQDIDVTHKTFRPREWWLERFKTVTPSFPVEIMGGEEQEKPIIPPGPDGLVKLNVGSFLNMYHHGWVNIDVLDIADVARHGGYVFRQLDVRQGLPWPENGVDLLLASHFLEHLTRQEGEAFLKECLHVLKPNGLIRLVVPDAGLITEKYLAGEVMEYRWVNVGVEKAKDHAEALWELLFSGHKTAYNLEALEKLLERVGFKAIGKMPYNRSQSETMQTQTIGMYPSLSLFVEARKPEAVASKVVASRAPSRLKVGLISTPFLLTPPSSYGGLEAIVANLARVLAARGHDVTVFAADGSRIEGCKVVEFGPPALKVQVDWLQAERSAYEVYKDMLGDFDVIHGNDWFGFEYAAKARNPGLKVLHTHHGGLNLDWWGKSRPPFKLNLVSISKWMAEVYRAQGFEARPVYNGVDLDRYPFKAEKGDRLLFVGRIDRFKQPDVAVHVAQKLGVGLDIVGGTFVQDPVYLAEVRDMCDDAQIKFHPDASHQVKLQLLQDARAVLFPSRMGEPFGLVPVEAMAAGTPVVALNDGAVEEVVREGGVVCDVFEKAITPKGPSYTVKRDAVEAMVEAVKALNVQPDACRRNAKRYSKERMADCYENLYNKIVFEGEEW